MRLCPVKSAKKGGDDERYEITHIEREGTRIPIADYCDPAQNNSMQTDDVPVIAPANRRDCPECAEKARIVRGQFAQICSACGYEVPAGESSWERLQEHVESCPKHPLGKALAENAELREAYDELRGFVRVVTLHLQAHRSKTDLQHTAMFDRAYSLYCKHDVENRKALNNQPAQREKGTTTK
jgi:hypothetical protein